MEMRAQGTEESSLSAIQNIYDVGSDLVSVRDPAPSCDTLMRRRFNSICKHDGAGSRSL